GETHAVREFLDIAFKCVNLDWQDYVDFDERYLRPAEVDLLLGDPTKTQQKLGWQPSVSFEELVVLMVEADLAALGISSPNGSLRGKHLQDNAYIRQNMRAMVD
ncbi:MAG: GDP-mannose 4,6-dehydratase, partial [Microcystaceae cyanobacterium]